MKPNNKKEKIILTDVDGVLLDYFTPFKDTFQLEQIRSDVNSFDEAFELDADIILGMVDMFNNSKGFGELSAFKDSVEYVHKLKEDGYKIEVITACGRSTHITEMRINNLERVFGKGLFDKYMFVEPDESKLVHLIKYNGSGYTWIEDSITNYKTGVQCGLDSILMDTDFNHSEDKLQHYYSWKEIYHHIQLNY